MKHRKHFIIFILLGLFIILLSFQTIPPPVAPPPAYVQEPPIVEGMWVRKLPTPLSNGDNIVMKIKYKNASLLPQTLDIYRGNGMKYTFRDDGVAPDITLKDGIYTAYVKENISAFRIKIATLMANLHSPRKKYYRFTGHLGQLIATAPIFNMSDFDKNLEVYLDMDLINGEDCGNEIKREMSLFITDLAVVEDEFRTYNVVSENGNPYGVWTFGNLIQNMVSPTNVTPQAFLKSWLKTWTTDQVVNGQTVTKREDVIKYLIEPWLSRCGIAGATLTDWEAKWENAYEPDILKYAPFKLTAIVNRIDLRGNSSYGTLINNAGEIRFIFSLIAPVGINQPPLGMGFSTSAGKVPQHAGQDFSGGNTPGFIDWEGMNLILEYGIPIKNKCALKEYAQKWVDLSEYTEFDDAYRTALENLTREVIDANDGTVLEKPNGSALNRIRTNERIFQPSNLTHVSWRASNWEFRQFEIDASTHMLKLVPVTNTPLGRANYPSNISEGVYNGYYDSALLFNTLIDWVYNPIRKLRVFNGNHNMPASMLAATGIVDIEYLHYWDFNWTTTVNNYNPSILPLPGAPNDIEPKQIRQMLSLNTCQGCHNGETKTIFTHVRPLGYGDSATYWKPLVDKQYRKLDTRDLAVSTVMWHIENSGKTGIDPIAVDNYPEPSHTTSNYYTHISAFLTGRNYSGIGVWSDDHPGDSDDQNMDGLFYVNDPSNDLEQTFPMTQRRWGYNDLLRRKNDLCQFINDECTESGAIIEILRGTTFIPLPLNGH